MVSIREQVKGWQLEFFTKEQGSKILEKTIFGEKESECLIVSIQIKWGMKIVLETG